MTPFRIEELICDMIHLRNRDVSLTFFMGMFGGKGQTVTRHSMGARYLLICDMIHLRNRDVSLRKCARS